MVVNRIHTMVTYRTKRSILKLRKRVSANLYIYSVNFKRIPQKSKTGSCAIEEIGVFGKSYTI